MIFKDWFSSYHAMSHPRAPGDVLASFMNDKTPSVLMEGVLLWSDMFFSKVQKRKISEKKISAKMSGLALLEYVGSCKEFLNINNESSSHEELLSTLDEFENKISQLDIADLDNAIEIEIRENFLELVSIWQNYVHSVVYDRKPSDKMDVLSGVGDRDFLLMLNNLSVYIGKNLDLVEELDELDKLYAKNIKNYKGLISENCFSLYPKEIFWWYYGVPIYMDERELNG